MWTDHENLTPEERLDRIADILSEGLSRLIEKNKRKKNKPQSTMNNNPRNKANIEGNIPSEMT